MKIKISGTNKQDDGFNFDLIGNILKILNRVNDCGISGSALGNNALDRNFEYDPLYRVISGDGRESDTQNQNEYLYTDAPIPGSPTAENVRAYKRHYSFDKLGNIQQLKQSGTNGFTRNFTYNVGKDTLQKIESAAAALLENYTYDPRGNQLSAGTTRNYVWNAGDQLITYYNQVGSANPTIFAQYDYSGMNRVSKLVKTGTSSAPIYERTIYIDGIFEYHILENDNTVEKNYIHLLDDRSRIAMIRIGDPFPDDISEDIIYNLEDQIGSSVLRLTNTGTTIDKEEYYPFGDSSLRIFSKKRYRYVGKEKDQESGLYYYGARYYAAWTCRFISIDPLAADYPFYTPYNYAGNKPINKIDIDGMQEQGAQPIATVKDNTNVVTPKFNSFDTLKPIQSPSQVYQINKKTGIAEKINLNSIKKSLSKGNLAKLEKGGHFIYREGRLSSTTEKTIQQINTLKGVESKLEKFALQKLRSDAEKYSGNFPENYYIEYSKSIIIESIKISGPDEGINNAYKMLGVENLPLAKSILQVYESIVPKNDDTHIDKVQHFIASAAKQYNYGKIITDSMQYGKEIFLDEIPSWFGNDIGFDPKDMKANNLGQAYGAKLFAKYHPVRNYLFNLD